MRTLTSKPHLYFYLLYFIIFIFTCRNPFFWDTIHLASMQAHWFFENGFNHLLLPQEIDSGHPPFLGLLLAAVWKTFGRSLFNSHLVMLPFIFLMIHQVVSLCKYLFGSSHYFLASGLVLFNTVLLGHSTLISPDVILYCFFFFTLNGIYRKNFTQVLIGSIFLSIISMRGMMCTCALFIFQLVMELRKQNRVHIFSKTAAIYLPAALLSLAFLYFHYSHTGWIGYHPLSPWANAFERVNFGGVAWNLVVFLWRFFDFGNLFIWTVFGGGILWLSKKPIAFGERSRHLLWLMIITLAVLVVPQLFYKILLSHRYLFPVIAVAALFVFSIALENLSFGQCRKLVWISILGMVTGNLWIYPDKIAKGWDSTLGHLPYYTHRKHMLDFIKQNKLNPAEIGAAFPYETDSKYIDLTNDSFAFVPKDFRNNRYILYSNVANDFTDDELLTLKQSWKPVKQSGRWPVRFILYENPLK